MIDKPMNPYASEDFTNAIKDASEELKKMGEQMKADYALADEPYVPFKSMDEPYCGTMRLNYDGGMLQLCDLFDALLLNGYEVTARAEDATKTEREVDGADKFIVIEYGEVE